MVSSISGISSLPGISALQRPGVAAAPEQAGFSDALARGLKAVSDLENAADAETQKVATGQGGVEDLMIAVSKAQLGIETLATVRDRAVEAYQEIMRMPL